MGLYDRKTANKTARANGNEPMPGPFAGVKRWARYRRRVDAPAIKIKNPARYLNASRRANISPEVK
jgi:hypothetical protein